MILQLLKKITAKSLITSATLLLLVILSNFAFAQMRITEYMYSGTGGEFVEFTNVGSSSIDMTGWSFDDATRTPGVHNLSAFGIVQPGESVIVTETSPVSTFRSAWGLCATIKITGGYTNDNLGRADEINLYDASNALIDRLTYNDQTLGGPRSQNKSAYVNAAGLGTNMPTQWTLSALADAEGSFASSNGDIGSPGKSTRATVSFNPCVVVNGAPTIVINVATTNNLLDGGLLTSPASPYGVSGVIDDPTDPAKLYGIDFTIGDDATPVENLVVTATSNNISVVPNSNVSLTGSGASWNVKITPAAVGYANVTVSVFDGTNTSSFIISYAASAAAAIPAATKWPTGISDASTAIALDDDYYVTADDEQNVLNVYSRSVSGLPFKSAKYDSNLALPDPGKPEVDVEAATRSALSVNRIYWLGSMSNGKAPFDDKPNRNRLFATTVTGTGAATSFSFVGYYGNLRASLIAWGDAHGYNFSASAAAGVDSKLPSGFAAEGMVFGPDDTTLYIGMRAPLVPTATRTKAVIAPILNFESWFNNGSPSGDPTFGDPIELNLGGRGIRELIRLSNGTYIILAGNPSADPVIGALYKWTGKAVDTPVSISSPSSDALNMEGALEMHESGQLSLSKLQVITDKGGDILYNDGVEAKDLGDNNLKKFRVDDLSSLDLNLCKTVFGDTTAVADNSFTWYDSIYTSTPTVPPTHTFMTAGGCDSIVTLHLTINHRNKLPVVIITSPVNGTSYPSGNNILLHADATDSDGSIIRVAFYNNGIKFAEDSTAPYEFNGTGVEAGNYVLTAKAFDDQGDSSVSDTVRITVTSCSGSGSISGYGYTNIPGSQLIDLASSSKYPSNPDVLASLNKFEYGPNLGDNYGARVRGYICAPLTGNYIFYLASDDQSELWLSTDDNPANITRIAYVTSRVGFRSWFTSPTQKSVAIKLIKGARYYIETIHKEGSGQDHLSVGWVLPNGVFEGPIPGSRLSPWESTPAQSGGGASFETAMQTAEQGVLGLIVTASPNPSPGSFRLTTKSNSDATITVTVVDAVGRIMERRQQVAANGTIEFGNNLRAGVYFVEVTQGTQVRRLKLIKE